MKADTAINTDTKFGECRATYSASKVIEIFMSSDTDDITNKLFGTNFYKNFKKQ